MLSTEFLLTSLIVVLIPGTGVIYTVSTGLFLGARASVAAALGCTLGIVPHLLASVCGLSMLLHMSALAFQLIKYAGACYLLYLAWGMWRDQGTLSFSTAEKTGSPATIVRRGFLINILNPKLSIFFLAFLPLFVSEGSVSPMLQMIMLSSVFMTMTLIVFILYGLAATGVRAAFAGSPRTVHCVRRSFALLFAALGLRLAAAER